MNEPRRFSRREFLTATGLAVGIPAAILVSRRLAIAGPRGTPGNVTIVDFDDTGVRKGVVTVPKVVKTDAEWKAQLNSDLAFYVARKGGTERAFSGAYWNEHHKGLFRCVCCGTALLNSVHKLDSGTGWPSSGQPIAEKNVNHGKASSGFTASEVTCRRCD